MSTPLPQIGPGVKRQGAPKFATIVIIDGTWKKKGDTQMLRTDDGDSEVYNYTFWRPGDIFSFEANIKLGEDELQEGTILESLAPDSRKFIILPGLNTEYLGGAPMKHTGSLEYRPNFTPVYSGGSGEGS